MLAPRRVIGRQGAVFDVVPGPVGGAERAVAEHLLSSQAAATVMAGKP